ncbi:MAG TPA: threonine synthase [Blastocatellia bacterium]|nr:threonine synthase [Blastocatellia bacterium]
MRKQYVRISKDRLTPMNNVSGFKCVECGNEHRVGDIEYVCASCGGNLDVVYDYDRIRAQISPASLAGDGNLTMWRYRALLPIDESSLVPPLTVGWTPVYNCAQIADRYAVGQLLIKDDGRNPTASFKDRPSALAVAKAKEAAARIITTASSGNAGSALAGMCASVGMESVIFVPASAPEPKIAQLQIYGAVVVLVEGSYDQAYDLCIEASRRCGWYQRSTGYNPFTREGKKTAALEIAEQLSWNVPDTVIVPVGDGNIISGLWKGFNDLQQIGFIDHLPRMIGIQSEAASAIVDAAKGDGIVREGSANTIADSINVGRPRDATMAVRAIRESGGLGVTVSDDQIVSAIPQLARETGVFAEPAAAAAYAGFVRLCDTGAFERDERVLLMVTGNGLKDVDAVRRAVGEPLRVPPDIDLSDLEQRIALRN